jgi:RimJ/RimL family protein N-acetyltransferase
VELRAGNLLLRPPEERDLDAIVEGCRDPDVPRFIPFVPIPYTEDDARAFLADVREAWRTTPERTFAVVDAVTDEFLGIVTVRLREGGSVGYWLKREARGRSSATARARPCCSSFPDYSRWRPKSRWKSRQTLWMCVPSLRELSNSSRKVGPWSR